MRKLTFIVILGGIFMTLGSCSDKKRASSAVFMPDMYYPVPYDPYMEANFKYPVNKETSDVPLFAAYNNMTALYTVEGTVPRTEGNILPWTLRNNNEDYFKSKEIKTSPLNPQNRLEDLKRAKKLYEQTCTVCHGSTGDGKGSIVKSTAYSGVPTYAEREISVGSVYHVIKYGKNAMGSYANQLSPQDSWRVAEYVMTLKSGTTDAPIAEVEAPVTEEATATEEVKVEATEAEVVVDKVAEKAAK